MTGTWNKKVYKKKLQILKKKIYLGVIRFLESGMKEHALVDLEVFVKDPYDNTTTVSDEVGNLILVTNGTVGEQMYVSHHTHVIKREGGWIYTLLCCCCFVLLAFNIIALKGSRRNVLKYLDQTGLPVHEVTINYDNANQNVEINPNNSNATPE